MSAIVTKTKRKKLTAAEEKLALELSWQPDLGSLAVHDHEYIFAWMALDPGAVKAAIGVSGEKNAHTRSRAHAAVDSFLYPHTDKDRFPIHIAASTGRVYWQLDLLPGVGSGSVHLLRDLYCKRNVTRLEMAEEMVLLRASPRGKEILEEAVRRDAEDALVRRQKREDETRAIEVVTAQARSEKIIEARWQILRLVRDLEDEMTSYAENQGGVDANDWVKARKALIGAHDRALRVLKAQLVPLYTERVEKYLKLLDESMALESKMESQDGELSAEDEARETELKAEMTKLRETLTPEEDWAVGVDCGDGKGDWRAEYVLP